jgi:hypothetical protein
MVVHHLSNKILCQSAYPKRRPDGRLSVISPCNGRNSCIRRSRVVHFPTISVIFALNRTGSAAKGTELNYFVAVIITSHRIFTLLETCYIELTNSNGTARNVSKSRSYLISRALPKYFSLCHVRSFEAFITIFIFEPSWIPAPTRNQGLTTMECILFRLSDHYYPIWVLQVSECTDRPARRRLPWRLRHYHHACRILVRRLPKQR